jgi:hypothetical protein
MVPRLLDMVNVPPPGCQSMGSGAPHWGDAAVEVLVESCSLGGQSFGGVKLGVGGPGGMRCGFTCLGDSGFVETG